MIKSVSVIGCGWLGLPLAESLVNQGYKVLGSTTSSDKLPLLQEKGIEPFLLKLDPMPVGQGFNRLFESQLLIVNIPPRRKHQTPEFYEEQLKYLKYQIQQSQVEKVIFVSSTSFYPNTHLEVDVTEPSDISNGSSHAVVQAEKQISQLEQATVILRCGGLMGKDRIPGKWFAGKSISGKDTPVNYIHQEDVIRIIEELIEDWPSSSLSIKNAVSDHHPTRGEVYQKMADKYGFEPPKWVVPDRIDSKIVKSSFTALDPRNPLDY